MPKKFPLAETRKWLDLYEKGKSEVSIAKQAHCDVRTVKKGIEHARREREAVIARTELLKEALRKHQDGLLETLEEILSNLSVPPVDSAVLAWETSSFTTIEAAKAEVGGAEVVSDDVALGAERRAEWVLLQEHLKRDPLWRVLADLQKALAAHLNAKIAFQRKTVSLLGEKTGYKVVDDSGAVTPPFVYIYTTGRLFFEVAIRRVLGIPDRTNPEENIVTDTTTGEVKHGIGTILAKAPGKEEECKRNLLAALKELQQSAEAVRVANTYKVLEESTAKARKAVEEILLLGLVTGQCRICRRLGI